LNRLKVGLTKAKPRLRGFATDPPAGGEFGIANPCEHKEFTPIVLQKSSQKIQSPFDNFKNLFLILQIVHLHEVKKCRVYSILGLYIHLLVGKGIYINELGAISVRQISLFK